MHSLLTCENWRFNQLHKFVDFCQELNCNFQTATDVQIIKENNEDT